MSTERWGTFSVRDHTFERPFVSDVIMYDRLVIPYPPDDKRDHWTKQKWQPKRLDAFLKVLRTDPNDPGRHAITVTWDSMAEQIYSQKRMDFTGTVNRDVNFQLTARTLAIDLLPRPSEGVVPIAIVATYPTVKAAETEWVSNDDPARRRQLTLALAHKFLVPKPEGKSELDLLKQAVDLADNANFQKKRAQMYEWQDKVIHSGFTDRQALGEMAQYIHEYDEATRKADKDVYTKFAFTLIPIGLAALHGPFAPAAGVLAIAGLVKFWIFDRQPVVHAEECKAAAMFHAAQSEIGWCQVDNSEFTKPEKK